jgi:hypothetical protein
MMFKQLNWPCCYAISGLAFTAHSPPSSAHQP